MNALFLFAGLIVVSPTAEPKNSTHPEQDAPPSQQSSFDGPIRRAIERDAAKLTVPASRPALPDAQRRERPASDWSRVTSVRPGTEIQLTTTGVPEEQRYLVHADSAELTVLNASYTSLPGTVRRRLREIAATRHGELRRARSNAAFGSGELRIAHDGVFLSGRRLADLDEILLTFPRANVVQVRRLEKRGAALGAAGGGTVGILAALWLSPYLMMKPCGGGCGGERFLTAASIVGLPLGGAVFGYLTGTRTVDVIGYRAHPPAQSDAAFSVRRGGS